MLFSRRRRSKITHSARTRRSTLRRRRLIESLETRQLLTVTPVTIDGGYQLQLSYEPGETIGNVEDVYLRTSPSGEIQYATEDSFGPYTDLGTNLTDGSVDSLKIEVVYRSQATGDWALFQQGLRDRTFSKLFVGNLEAPGVDLDISAPHIEVSPGSVVTTRNQQTGADPLTDASVGDSGDLVLDSSIIDIKGSLLTQVGDDDTVNTAGNITINATGNLSDIASSFATIPVVPGISITQAAVSLDSAVVRGGDITIDVESDASDLFDDEDEPGAWGEPLAEYVGSLSVIAGVALSESTAELDISNSSIVGRNVTLSSESATDAEATVLSFYAAVAYGHSIPHATVDIRDGSSIEATDDLSISTKADSDLSIIATQNLIGTSTVVEKRNVTLAGAYSDVVSSA
ncbi:MAG: hypothetical protein AAF802_27185, partial [Planctomycetota bacterium]